MTAKTGLAIGLAALGTGIGVWGIAVATRPLPSLTVHLPAPPAPSFPAAAEPLVVEPSAPAPPAPAPAPVKQATSGKKRSEVKSAREPLQAAAQPAGEPAPAPAAPPPAPPATPAPEPAPPPPVEAAARPATAPHPPILKPDAAAAQAEPRKAATVTIPAGTLITVRLREALSSEHQTDGDLFHATLDQPLVIEGMAIAERGSLQRGRVVSAVRSGKVKGRASLSIDLTELSTSDGQRVPIKTDTFLREADSTVGRDAMRTGVAAGIGAAIGAMIGGGKGAAIGAGAGGAAGAGGTMITRGAPAELASETRLTFRLSAPVTITERFN